MGIPRFFLSFVTVVFVWKTVNVVLASAEFKFLADSPYYLIAHLGENLVINCTTNDPDAQVFLYRRLMYPFPNKWMRLTPKTPNKISKTGQVYIVKNIDSKDDGYYKCNATDSEGRSIEWKDEVFTIIRNRTALLASLRLHPKSRVDLVGKSVFYTCTATIRAKWLKWFKVLDGNRLVLVSDNSKVNNDQNLWTHNLVIKHVQVKDSGLYRCVMEYRGAKRWLEANLTVFDYEAPIIKSSGPVQVVRSTRRISINCSAVGYPLATFKWYKNRTRISPSSCNDTKVNPCKSGTKYWTSLSQFPRFKKVKSTLTILDAVFPADNTFYTCMADNTKSNATTTIFVKVLVGPNIFSQKHKANIVGLGTSINETCSATGNPLPDVVWTRTDDPNRQVLARGQGKALLVVKDVQKKDLGNYTCNATNTVMSVTALLTIKESKEAKVLSFVSKGMPKSVVIWIICGSVFFSLIVIIVCFILYRRQQNRTRELKLLYFIRMGNANYVIDPDRSLLEQCNNLPYDLDWEFPEERLILGDPLGSGAFGQVLKAEAIGMPAFKPRDKTTEARWLRSQVRKPRRKRKGGQNSAFTAKQTVAVKTLQEGATENDYKDLASELKILIHLGEHKNIVNLLGACTRGRRLMVIIEYAPHGDLLSFLRARRDIYDADWVKTSNNPEQEFTLVDLAMTAYQISRGMEYLASRKCVHRDLAARNVLVGENYVMKISDFGLARDIYQDDLYVKTTSGLLPVKWMALESLFDRVYTEKSDVWSFGIVLWEIFTLGGCPYPSVPLGELADFLVNDNRMDKPLHCPPEIYNIMEDCWRKIPEQRPTFEKLSAGIKKIIEKNAPKGNPQTHIEVVREPMRASNEYLTSAESMPTSSRKPDPLAKQPSKTPNRSDGPSKNGAVPMNGIIEPEENSNSFFQKDGNGEEKPLLPQSTISSSRKQSIIKQHESAV